MMKFGCSKELEYYWHLTSVLSQMHLTYAASQVSGSKFYYLKNEAVLLEMALVNWTLSEVMKRGFTPLTTPELVRSSVVEKCGFQPRANNTQVCECVLLSCCFLSHHLLVNYS